VTVVAVLDELAGVVEEIAAGRAAPFDDDRSSLHQDAQVALERAGGRLREIGSPPLRRVCIDYLRDLSDAYSDRTRASALAAKFRTTIEQLRSPEAVETAFDDVIEVLKDGTAYCDVCALRVAQLAELVELRGHDWTAMQMALSSYTADDDIAGARVAMASEPCNDLVAVWLAFGNADLHKGYQRVGPVQFFKNALTPRDIRDGCPALNTPEFEPAAELADHISTSGSTTSRASTTCWRASRCRARARSCRRPASRSRPSSGRAMSFAASSRLRRSASAGPTGCARRRLLRHSGRQRRRWRVHGPCVPQGGRQFTPPPHEPTSEKLEQLDQEFAKALARGDDVAKRGVEEVLWHRAVNTVEDDAVRVALHVRGFETQWVIGKHGAWPVWEEAVKKYLIDHWAYDGISSELFTAAFDIRHRQDLARSRGVSRPLTPTSRSRWAR
jgi:hypothetical protein